MNALLLKELEASLLPEHSLPPRLYPLKNLFLHSQLKMTIATIFLITVKIIGCS